ncbi:beta-ketoacyl-ACP synthase 3 [Streptomyces sp. 4N509B]|uniref:beta-ketoacyl-ACP synthase 3 n=1 Tax=Streptomyces sp. 4N509B TaxID=3457413 RepID=UPI003FD0FD76
MRQSVSTAGIRNSAILGVGGYRPRRVVDNDEICQHIDSSEEWILTRSGIVERRFAGPDETLLMMATTAAEKAMAQAGTPPGDIDLVLVASITYVDHTPPLAARVAHELGAHRAGGFDLGAACAGFCHGLAVASDAVRVGSAERVLVIASERLTDIVELTDRSISFLFADGAGAAVVGPSDLPGIGPVVRRSKGVYHEAAQMSGPWAPTGDHPGPAPGERPYLRVDGRRIFRWAVDEIPPAAREALAAADVPVEELGAFVPHQANLRITELLVERIGLTERTAIARDIEYAGNTSAASVPLAMETLLTTGQVASGDTALLAGFGGGLNFAAQVVVLP